MIATWVMSTTLAEDRPRILTVLSPGGYTLELIRRSRRFVAQLLSEGQEALIPRFGLHSGRDFDKLSDLSVSRTRSGLAIVDGCAGWAECKVLEEVFVWERVILFSTAAGESACAIDKPALTLGRAYEVLPPEVVEAMEAQRRRDGLRDRPLSIH
jgi:flavin reductase (DIM6/NTAB) family NADH-FMN oxidoreductase RutF